MTQHYYESSSYSDGYASGFRMTHAVQRLILLNAAVFALQLVVNVLVGKNLASAVGRDAPGGFLLDWVAFQPDRFLQGWIWLPITYMFLHAGLSHLFMNMIGLFFFGPDVERVLSTRQFYRFYVLCGALAVGAEFALWGLRIVAAADGVPVHAPSVVGASGAAMGVLVAFATLYPDREILLFPLPFRFTARGVVIIFIVMNLMSALTGPTSVSWATHFGGMAVGYAYIKFVPLLRERFSRRRQSRPAQNDPMDKLGEAIDNIFKFEEEKKRRK